MLKIKNKVEFEGNLWTGLVDCSKFNASKENRIKAVTDIAAICKGRLGFKERYSTEEEDTVIGEVPCIAKVRQKLYDKLLVESGGNPSSPFEFIPVKIGINQIRNLLGKEYLYADYVNKVLKYSYYLQKATEPEYLLTNMRTLLKAGIKEEDIPFNTSEELEGFKVVVGRWPKIAFDHIVRHGQLRPNAESSRNKKYLKEVEFYYPSEYPAQKIYDYEKEDNLNKALLLENESKSEDSTKELSCRRLILSVWNGWKQDPNTWDNLFRVRGDGTGTQNVTGQVVNSVKELIYGK